MGGTLKRASADAGEGDKRLRIARVTVRGAEYDVGVEKELQRRRRRSAFCTRFASDAESRSASSNCLTRASEYSSTGYTAAGRRISAPSSVASISSVALPSSPSLRSTAAGSETCPFLPSLTTSIRSPVSGMPDYLMSGHRRAQQPAMRYGERRPFNGAAG